MSVNPHYFLREISQSFKRNIFLNLSSISTVMVLVFQLGFFILIIANINNFATIAMGKLQITVELVPDLSIEKTGKLKYRILKNLEVKTARYVNKEQAFRKLQAQLQNRVELENLTRNPLPDTIVVELIDPEKISEIAGEFAKYPGVNAVHFGDTKLIDRIIQLSHRIYIVGVIIIGMLLFSAVFLIANTIKLTVFSRRKEIAIMELVGAAHWFIRGPFIVEGLIHGLLGSGIAILLLNFIYSISARWIAENMPYIPILLPEQITLQTSLLLLSVGILVGTASSYVSVNKYLKI